MTNTKKIAKAAADASFIQRYTDGLIARGVPSSKAHKMAVAAAKAR